MCALKQRDERRGQVGGLARREAGGAEPLGLEPEDIYAGGESRPVVMVELKLASIGLGTVAARAAFITAATDVVEALTVAGHARDDTWVNILNAPDGGWGIGGVAYTGVDLIGAVTASAGR